MNTWTMAEEVGYQPKTTFWEDFSIADMFGSPAIRDTFNRAFDGWKHDHIYLTELVMVLNHKIWQHYRAGREEKARLYDRLWRQARDYAYDNLKNEELTYFLNTTD